MLGLPESHQPPWVVLLFKITDLHDRRADFLATGSKTTIQFLCCFENKWDKNGRQEVVQDLMEVIAKHWDNHLALVLSEPCPQVFVFLAFLLDLVEQCPPSAFRGIEVGGKNKALGLVGKSLDRPGTKPLFLVFGKRRGRVFLQEFLGIAQNLRMPGMIPVYDGGRSPLEDRFVFVSHGSSQDIVLFARKLNVFQHATQEFRAIGLVLEIKVLNLVPHFLRCALSAANQFSYI